LSKFESTTRLVICLLVAAPSARASGAANAQPVATSSTTTSPAARAPVTKKIPTPPSPTGAPMPPTRSDLASAAPAKIVVRPPKFLAPFGLTVTNDITKCAEHTNLDACKLDMSKSRVMLIWSSSFCTETDCAKRIDGYHVYNVPKGWRPPREPSSPAQASLPAGFVARSQSSSVSRSSTTNAAIGASSAMPKGSEATAAIYKADPRVLVASLTSLNGAQTESGDAIKGKCYTVTAFLGENESPNSDPYCVPNDAPTGLTTLTLNPIALATGYYESRGCTAVPPPAHPAGSVVVGFKMNEDALPCLEYQGLVKFDLSHIYPNFVKSATLVYSKVANYKLDGTVENSEGACYAGRSTTSTDWETGVTDPRHGQTLETYRDDSDTSGDVFHANVTNSINAFLKGRPNHGFVMGGSNNGGRGAYCYSSFGQIQLIVQAYGTR
jgi:hypothetical protein